MTRSSGSKSGSGRISASSAFSACVKEEAKQAALEAKAAILKEQQALALREAQLQAEKEELEIKMVRAVMLK